MLICALNGGRYKFYGPRPAERTFVVLKARDLEFMKTAFAWTTPQKSLSRTFFPLCDLCDREPLKLRLCRKKLSFPKITFAEILFKVSGK